MHAPRSSEGVFHMQRPGFSAALFWHCFLQFSLLRHGCKFTLQQDNSTSSLVSKHKEKAPSANQPSHPQGYPTAGGEAPTRNQRLVLLLSVLYLL